MGMMPVAEGTVVRRFGFAGQTRVLGYQEEDESGTVLRRYYRPPSHKDGEPLVPVVEWPLNENWEPQGA
jgi:hypothetical protein